MFLSKRSAGRLQNAKALELINSVYDELVTSREANHRRGGKRAVVKLNEHRKNKSPQTASESLGKIAKQKGNQSGEIRHGAPRGILL
jgi:hypothetical protein